MNQKRPNIYERKYKDINLLGEIDPIIAKVLSSRGVKNKAEYNYNLSALAPISSLENLDSPCTGEWELDFSASFSFLSRSF